MTTTRAMCALAGLSATALLLTACGSDSESAADDGEIVIVASTNVYGDVASAIAGDLATVNSIITSSAQDPHEYEASAQDRLAVDDADLVIQNGGGYDAFVEGLLEGDSDPVVLDVVEISGLAPEEGEEHSDEEGHDHEEGEEHSDEEGHDHEEGEEHSEEEGASTEEEGEEHSDEEGHDHDHEGHDHIEGFNEHVWYDFHAIEALAEEISHELGELDPDNASAYEANYEAFLEEIEGLEGAAEELRSSTEGQQAMITEPVPVYLLEELGMENITPEDFSEAVEEGADVPPRTLQETLDLFAEEDVAVLAYNSQTEDSTTEQVRTAAEEAGVPVVDFSETLPEGQTYVEWQQSNIDNLAAVAAS